MSLQLLSPMLTFWVSYILLIPLFNSRLIHLHTQKVSSAPNKYYYVSLNFLASILFAILLSRVWVIPQNIDPVYLILCKYLISMAIADVWFYVSHRLMHHRYLWKYHSIHHRIIFPRAFTCVYCHWIEMVLCNIPTVILGPFLLNMDLYSLHLWIFMSCFSTMYGHSGGEFKVVEWKNNYHYYHHTFINGNYAMYPFIDNVFRTNLKAS
jgi:sterol desaturase/sphingolipid hydroxylase (fatty acid hydroxylase superfamily)